LYSNPNDSDVILNSAKFLNIDPADIINIKSIDVVYKHYKDGKSMSELAKLTDRNYDSVENDIIHIFEHYDGVDIDVDYFGLTEEFEEEIKNAVTKVGSEFLKPIKDIVNNKITYGQIKLYLLISKLE
jgi:ATP-dependent DNA helicase RecQ